MTIHYEDFDPALARLCKCGDRLDDHDNSDPDIIGGQCFECPCMGFVAVESPDENAPSSEGR